ncbi:MAG: MATE family efflux transporter [Tannerella sp.]|jgi:putative MATE family efflux protein|nr:MATE family efflux transporter [Tannerella sp.]
MYRKRDILKVAFPVLLSLLAQNVINVTDTAFLGRVGEVELGASAMGGLYYICAFTIAFGFSMGAQIIIGRRNGEGQFAAVGPVLFGGITFLFMLAAGLFAFTRRTGAELMRWLISSEAVLEATMDFLDIRVYGFFFSFVHVMFRALFVGLTRTRALTFNALLMSLTNVALDRALIFGHGGFPQMGVRGAALASVVAEGVSVVFFLTYTFLTVDRRKYGLTRLRVFDFGLMKRILRVSVFMMMQHFVSMSTFFLFFLVVERLGLRSLAVANIVRSMYIVLFIPVNAFSTAVNTLVSNTMGAGRSGQVIPLVRRTAMMSLGVMLVCSTVTGLFPHAVLRIYTNDASLIADSVASLQVVAVATLVASAASVVFNALSGAGNTRPALVVEMATLVVYTLFIYVAGIRMHLPVHVCFIAEPVYFAGMFAGSVLYFRFAPWRDRRI